MWLVWLALAVVAGILLLWGALFVGVAVGAANPDELCPRCGISLGVSELDRSADPDTNQRYRSKAADHCFKCGWNRAGSEP